MFDAVDDRLGDLFRGQHADAFGRQAHRQIGLDGVRHHGGERHAGALELVADRFGQADDRELGRVVDGETGDVRLAGHRGDVDDVTAPALDHQRQHELHAEDRTAHVDVNLRVAGRVALVEEAPGGHDAGVVHEHVDRTDLAFDEVDKSFK